MHATKAAVEEGVVAGGGAALLDATRVLEHKKGANPDQQVGIEIVRRALQAPVRQIAENAGFDGAVVAGRMLDQKDVNFGFDAQKAEYVNMIKAGVIDPTKVVRTALQGAVSVAGLLVTTEAMVAEVPAKNGHLQCRVAAWPAIGASSPPRSRRRGWGQPPPATTGTGGVMTLRLEYSLGHSEYNAFLYTAVGEEESRVPLTVLTALTRLGFEPWREAARLSDLPKETAARAFAVTIAMLPEGDWKVSDSEVIAARLVSWLPGRSAAAIPSVEAAPCRRRKMKSGIATWLAWGVLAVALLFLGLHLLSDNNLEFGRGTNVSTQQ